jgi:hypothetical protein
MKIHISADKRAPRPTQPAVSLSDEAYEALLALSDKHNISMRKLASAIILEVCGKLEVTTDGK